MKAFKNLINGQWVDAAEGGVLENHNPARVDEPLGTFPSATREDVQRAIAAAREARRGWAATPPPSRGAILYKASQLIETVLGQATQAEVDLATKMARVSMAMKLQHPAATTDVTGAGGGLDMIA